MKSEKLQRQAKAIIASGLIEKTETGYQINRPTFRGVQMGEPFTVENGKCTCYEFADFGVCAHTVATEILTAEERQSKIEAARAKVREILESNHVSSVEVGFEEEFGRVRIYSAITKDNGIPHLYRVRVEDDFTSGERATTAKCNCAPSPKGFVCRHVAAVAKEDSLRMDREIYPVDLANYRAYQSARMAA